MTLSTNSNIFTDNKKNNIYFLFFRFSSTFPHIFFWYRFSPVEFDGFLCVGFMFMIMLTFLVTLFHPVFLYVNSDTFLPLLLAMLLPFLCLSCEVYLQFSAFHKNSLIRTFRGWHLFLCEYGIYIVISLTFKRLLFFSF